MPAFFSNNGGDFKPHVGARLLPIVFLVISCLVPSWSQAKEDSDRLPAWLDLAGPPEPSDKAIQRRKYELVHELSLRVGTFPVDPFYKAYSGTAGYTYHFSNYVGWEIASFTYALDLGTNLKQALIDTATVPITAELPEIQWFGASRLVIKPFYGKEAFLDAALIHLEVYIHLGPTLAQVQHKFTQTAFSPGLDTGFGFRLWLNSVVSLRAEINEMLFILPGGLFQALHADLGVSFNFGADE